jgi:hypothetical protein
MEILCQGEIAWATGCNHPLTFLHVRQGLEKEIEQLAGPNWQVRAMDPTLRRLSPF